METRTTLGQFIAHQRKKRSMSSQELANMLSISVSYLSQLEHGVRVNPNIELLLHLSEALHLSSEETEVLFDLYASVNDALSPEDANQTGTINATDAQLVLNHAANIGLNPNYVDPYCAFEVFAYSYNLS